MQLAKQLFKDKLLPDREALSYELEALGLDKMATRLRECKQHLLLFYHKEHERFKIVPCSCDVKVCSCSFRKSALLFKKYWNYISQLTGRMSFLTLTKKRVLFPTQDEIKLFRF